MQLKSLYCRDGETPLHFSKHEAAVSLVQKGIHGFLNVEMIREDVNGLHRILHICEFNPRKGARGIPKTFQPGEVTIDEKDIDDDETLRKEYADTNIIVLLCWKIPRRSSGEAQNAGDNSADKLIETIRQHSSDNPPENALSDSQTEMVNELEAVNIPKNGRRMGWLERIFKFKNAKEPRYSVFGTSSNSSIDTEHGIHNCFTYAVYMLSGYWHSCRRRCEIDLLA